MDNPCYIESIELYPKTGRCKSTFRQGLNVIISIDTKNEIKSNDDVNQEKNNNLNNKIRNSVGKTTFINLIDYVFGKSSFIDINNSELVEFFKEKFIISEVSFHGEKFTVKRSIIDSDNIVLFDGWVKSKVIEINCELTPYEEFKNNDEYIKFLNKKIYKNSNLFDKKYYTTYRSIMNYLIRDQYNGFNRFDSGINSEKSNVKKNRLEFLLGIITKEINELKLKIDELTNEKKELENKKNILDNYFCMKIGSKSDVKGKLKDINGNIKINEKKIKEIDEKYKDTIFNIEKLQHEKNEMMDSVFRIKEEMEIFYSKHTNYKLAINDILNEIEKIDDIKNSIDIFSSFEIKKCPYMLKAFKEKCEYLDWDSTEEINKITDSRRKILLYEKLDLEKAINKNLIIYKKLKDEKIAIEDRIQNIYKEIDKLKEVYTNEIEEIQNKINELNIQKHIISEQVKNYDYIDEVNLKIKDKKTQIKNKKDEINNQKLNVVGDLNTIFNKIIKNITNDERIGNINQNTYEPNILFKNTKKLDNGAAMKNLAIIAFDIALLEFSLKYDNEGTHYPRLLIHDSPRKNDLQDWLYFNVFEYIVSLEKEYFPRNKHFQYIITTLDLPEKINNEKYIRLTLDNSGEEGKLFGRNIGA